MRRRGFTIVEILIVALLLVLSAGFGITLMVRGFSAEQSIGGKVQVVHEAQMASLRLSESLHDATELFAPAIGGAESRPFALFSNHVNELVFVYVDDKQRLIMLNRNTKEKQVLATGCTRFRVYRRGRRLLNYHVALRDANSGEKLSFLGGVCVRNNLN